MRFRHWESTCGKQLLAVLLLVGALSPAAWAESDMDRHQKMVDEGAILTGPLSDYVEKVGNRIVVASGHSPEDFKFFVIDDSSVNAFATGSAYIYVHRGLLAYVKTEDQLAGVLGHEVGHVTARHLAKRRSRAGLNKAAGFALGVLTGNRDLMDVAQMYGQEKLIGYGREQELESDRLGAEYLAKAGYDPLAMIEVVQILKDQQVFSERLGRPGATYHAVFSSHPRNDRRLQKAVGAATVYQTDEVAEPVDDILSRLDGLVFGNAGAAGAVRSNKYYHGKLGFVITYPEGWAVFDSSAKVVGYPDAGNTDTYISMELDQPEKDWTPLDFIEKRAKPGATLEGEETTVGDGYPAYLGRITSLDPKGAVLVSQIAVVYKGPRAFVFRGETRAQEDVALLDEAFRETVMNLRQIEFADLQEANTERVKVVEARPGDTYEVLAKTTPLRDDPADQLRLLNGDYPNGQPRAGDRIKVVE